MDVVDETEALQRFFEGKKCCLKKSLNWLEIKFPSFLLAGIITKHAKKKKARGLLKWINTNT